MINALRKDEQISLFLSRLIPIDEIRYAIIRQKNTEEKEDALHYHIERVATIGGKYYASFQMYRGMKIDYSLIIDKQIYEAEKDRNLMFYNETGISFQVRSLLLDILSFRSRKWTIEEEVELAHFLPPYKARVSQEDLKLSFLAKK